MKLYYKSEKWIKYSKKVAKKALKRKRKKKLRLKVERRLFYKKTRVERKQNKDFYKYVKVSAPKNFSFLTNAEEVIVFINHIEELLEKRKRTYIVLKKVENIDYGAITVLLSIMFKFKESKVKFNGNFPQNLEIRRIITESGFFASLLEETRKSTEYVIGSKNQIITHSQKNVNSTLGVSIIEEVSTTVWGEKKVSKGLQRVLVELMQNTNNHAVRDKKGEKLWWVSVNHDKENNKVSFVFMDHGIGIFSSLYNKNSNSKWYGWADKVKSALGVQTDEKVLQMLLEGKLHLTVTGEKYRGKGLPSVNIVLERNQISNLHIITNNVYGSIVDKNYRLLGATFKGTFFYWELCNNNDNVEWTIKS